MIRVFVTFLFLVAATNGYSQVDVQPLFETQKAFEKAVADHGIKRAFLDFLSDDSVVFRPDPVNGKQYWNSRDDDASAVLVRKSTYADIASSGKLGYTTGNWRLYQKGKTEGLARFGQYVTIWELGSGGRFLASVDIAVGHEKMPYKETDKLIKRKQTRDANKRNWSPADASMNFLRMSMTGERLGGAYKKFAADDVRLLRDGYAPIIGKKRVVDEMGAYVSVEFPTKVSLFQSADMAYTWNPCRFDNSNEGAINGNCLHIWKLRKKKWWIVLGVFAPVPNETAPVLKKSTGR